MAPATAFDMFVSGMAAAAGQQAPGTQAAPNDYMNEAAETGTNLYIIRTPLARWNEECAVLDANSMYHQILLVKPKIIAALEKYRAEELAEKREKRQKELEKMKKAEGERVRECSY